MLKLRDDQIVMYFTFVHGLWAVLRWGNTRFSLPSLPFRMDRNEFTSDAEWPESHLIKIKTWEIKQPYSAILRPVRRYMEYADFSNSWMYTWEMGIVDDLIETLTAVEHMPTRAITIIEADFTYHSKPTIVYHLRHMVWYIASRGWTVGHPL